MKSHLYRNKQEALEAAKSLGCEGYHKTKRGSYKPCKNNKELLEVEKSEEPKEELEELVDFDGTMNNSKVPILDPRTTEPGLSTMDKRVASGHQTQDPLMRGYRVYYGESVVKEEDMADAFGFEETQFMDAKETIDYFIDELDFDEKDAEDRASEMGKDEDMDKNSRFKKFKNFVMRGRLVEKEKTFTKEEVQKMAEDIVLKKSEDKGLTQKEDDDVSPIIRRNIKALKNMADSEGISIPTLIKMFKNE